MLEESVVELMKLLKCLHSGKVDLCCLQETRWRAGLACLIEGNNAIYKVVWCGMAISDVLEELEC